MAIEGKQYLQGTFQAEGATVIIPEEAQPLVSQREEAGNILAYGLQASVVGAASTMLSSLGVVDAEEFDGAVKDSSTFPDFGAFYGRNAEGAKMAGELVAGFAPILLGAKAMRATSYVGDYAATKLNKPWVRAFLHSGKTQQQRVDPVLAQAMELAKKRTKNFTDVTQSDKDGIQKLISAAKWGSAKDTMLESLAGDAALYLTMNESELYFPDSMTAMEQIALFGAVNTGVSLMSSAVTNRMIKYGLATQVAEAAAKAENLSSDIIYRQGSRGAGIGKTFSQVKEAQTAAAAAPLDTTLAQNVKSELNVANATLTEQASLLFKDKPYPAISNVEPISKAAPEMHTFMYAGEKDPTIFLDAVSFERYTAAYQASFDTLHAKAAKRIDAKIKRVVKLKRSGKVTDAQKVKLSADIDAAYVQKDALYRTVPMVVETDGSLVNLSARRPIYHDSAKLNTTFRKNDSAMQFNPRNVKGLSINIDVYPTFRFKASTPRRVDDEINVVNSTDEFKDFSLYEKSVVFYGLQKQVEAIDDTAFSKLIIDNADSWVTKEAYASAAIKLGKAVTPELEFSILAGKYDDYVSIMARQSAMDRGEFILNESLKLSFSDVAKSINVPPNSPVLELFEDLRITAPSGTKLTELIGNKAALDQALAKYMPKDAQAPENFTGNMLNIDTTKKPFVMLYRHNKANLGSVTSKDIDAKLFQQRQAIATQLQEADSYGAGLVGAVAKSMFDVPEAYQAAKQGVQLLREGTQANKDRFFTATFANRTNQTIQDASLMSDVMEKASLAWMKQEFVPFESISKEILRPKNAGDLNSLLFAINARRRGWELDSAPEFDADAGLWFLKLKADSTSNKKLWAALGGDTLPKNARMPSGIGKAPLDPVGITDLAMQGFRSFNKLSKSVFANENHIRKMQGLAPLAEKEWHIISKDMTAPEQLFLVNSAGKLHQMVSGRSVAEVTSEARKIQAASSEPLLLFTRADIANYKSIEGEAFSSVKNFQSAALQTGEFTGKSVGEVVDVGAEAYREVLEGYQRQFTRLTKSTVSTLFEPELMFAAQQKASARLSKRTLEKSDSIWDQYANALLGQGSLNKAAGIGWFHLGAEEVYDRLAQATWDKLVKAERKTPIADVLRNNDFAATADALGKFNPLKSLNEYAKSTQQLTPPPSMRKNMATLSGITAALSLRILDAGMMTLNLTSLAATTPAVVKMLQRAPGESEVAWHRRIRAYGSPVTDTVAELKPIRAVMAGAHFFWTKEGRQVLKAAKEAGYIKQEVAEKLSVFQAPARGYAKNLLVKSVDALSVLTDKSEEFSRAFSFMTGYKMAKDGLKLNHENAMLFGHDFANKNIGDYRPNIRPQLFQGAAGMPLGLFTTWVQNFLQRLYNTAENKQWAAVINQVGMQTALFGATSVPGFNQFNEILQSNYNGSENLADRLYERYNDDAVDVLLSGSLSNIPKLFGADDGIDMSSRAQVGLPGIFTAGTDITQGPGAVVKTAFEGLPVVNMLGSFKNIANETLRTYKETNELDASQFAEIVAQYSTHKLTRSGIELAQGYATDRRGDLLTEDTRTGISIAARAAGLKPLREAQRQQTLYRSRQIDLYNRELRNRLGKAIRQTIRDGGDEKQVMQAFNKHVQNYIKSGGSLKYLRPYLAEQFLRATQPKADREFLKALKASDDDGDAVRYLRIAQ